MQGSGALLRGDHAAPVGPPGRVRRRRVAAPARADRRRPRGTARPPDLDSASSFYIPDLF